jgi:hypothetical protein
MLKALNAHELASKPRPFMEVVCFRAVIPFFFWKLKLANQKVPDLNLHAFRYFFKSTVGKPLQVWLHVCAWWITAYGFADVSEIAKQSWCLSSFCLYCISRCVGAVVSDKSLRNIRMNVRAFAVAQNPYLLTRGRGQLH